MSYLVRLCSILFPVILTCLLSSRAYSEDAEVSLSPNLEITQLADDASGYATFHGDIPHAAANKNGIFVVYLSHEEADSSNTWTLERSIDGGKSFSKISSGTMHKAPEIETDDAGNIYLFGSNYSSGGDGRAMQMLIFKADDDYAQSQQIEFSNEAAGKSTAVYDRGRHQFYYIGFGVTPFLAIKRSGEVIRKVQIFTRKGIASVEYPFMAMDRGRLYVAWTTTPTGDCGGSPQNWHCTLPVYYSIHFIYSDDGGASWRAPGATDALRLPIDPATDGPAPNVVPPSYLGQQTAFLAGFTVDHDTAHFMYMVRPLNREIYQSFNVSPFKLAHQTENSRGAPQQSDFGGGRFMAFSLYGVFSHNNKGDLYAITTDNTKQDKAIPQSSPLVILRSSDAGASWREVAHSAPFGSIFAINSPRIVSPQYGVMGLFTASATGGKGLNSHQVYFFRMK